VGTSPFVTTATFQKRKRKNKDCKNFLFLRIGTGTTACGRKQTGIQRVCKANGVGGDLGLAERIGSAALEDVVLHDAVELRVLFKCN